MEGVGRRNTLSLAKIAPRVTHSTQRRAVPQSVSKHESVQIRE